MNVSAEAVRCVEYSVLVAQCKVKPANELMLKCRKVISFGRTRSERMFKCYKQTSWLLLNYK